MITRSYAWPRYYRRIWRRVCHLIDPVTMELRPRYGKGGA